MRNLFHMCRPLKTHLKSNNFLLFYMDNTYRDTCKLHFCINIHIHIQLRVPGHLQNNEFMGNKDLEKKISQGLSLLKS